MERSCAHEQSRNSCTALRPAAAEQRLYREQLALRCGQQGRWLAVTPYGGAWIGTAAWSREEAAPPHVTATAPWPITFHVNYWPLHVVSATAVAVVTSEHGALQQERVDALKRRVSDNVTSQLGTFLATRLFEVHCPCGWHFRCEDNLHDIWLHHGQKQCTAEGIHLYALLSYKGRKHVLHALQS